MDRAARRAGRVLARDFSEVQHLQASRKGTQKFSRAALRKATEIIKYELTKARPSFNFLGEPIKPENLETKNEWIINPLDGTSNYAHGQPHFCISIAHIDDNDLKESIVYDPLGEEIFWAVKNTGAYLNDTRLRVSARSKPSESIIATFAQAGGKDENINDPKPIIEIVQNYGDIRISGSPSLDLAYLAAGRFDGCYYQGLLPENIVPGTLIVSEAGGLITDLSGKNNMSDSGEVIAANGELYEGLFNCIKSSNYSVSEDK
jgi:myo-inositol-1(or 4)-monophosphatase|tara:strand:+ start:3728 stop:4510 length:783 start_codon:yes stop_codon:yes gene_type:complete